MFNTVFSSTTSTNTPVIRIKKTFQKYSSRIIPVSNRDNILRFPELTKPIQM